MIAISRVVGQFVRKRSTFETFDLLDETNRYTSSGERLDVTAAFIFSLAG
jgi:hypothetical protein